MSTEGRPVQKPDWLTSNINLGNILTLVVLGGGVAYGYGSLTNRMDSMEAYRVERTRTTDLKFDQLTILVKDLPSLAYRVTATEEALKATNARVDASLQNISQRLAEVNQSLGALDTKVAVLTQRIEAITPQRRADRLDPTGFMIPVPIEASP